MKLFGLTGKMHAGKDTFFNYVQARDAGVTRVAFGDALKAEVAAACGVSVPYINEHKDVFRPILQWWGTDFRRRLHGENYWIQRVADTLAGLPAAAVVFITDVRFPDEAAFVRSRGGQVIKLLRPALERDDSPRHGHDSETKLELIEPDFSVTADRLDELNFLAWQWWARTLAPVCPAACK